MEENKSFFDEIELILFEADQTHICDYDKIRDVLKEKKFIEI
jgi:hypothetical protein